MDDLRFLKSVVVADGLAPFVGKRYGLLLLQVVQHQYRQAPALHLLRISVNDLLFQMKTLVAEFDGTGAYGNPVSAFNLGKELHFYLYHEDSIPIPVKTFAHGRYIVSLTRVVELKIDGIVYVSELVNVVETYLQWHHIVKLVTSFFCHIAELNLLKSAAKLHIILHIQANICLFSIETVSIPLQYGNFRQGKSLHSFRNFVPSL